MDYSAALNSPAQSGQDPLNGDHHEDEVPEEEMELDVHHGDFPMDLDPVGHEAEALHGSDAEDDLPPLPVASPRGHLAGSSEDRGHEVPQGPSGSDQLEAQPGPSNAGNSGSAAAVVPSSHNSSGNNDDVSESTRRVFMASGHDDSDDEDDSNDVWGAASSSGAALGGILNMQAGPSGPSIVLDDSQDSLEGGGLIGSSSAAVNPGVSVAPSGTSGTVSVPTFSPQPSSSSAAGALGAPGPTSSGSNPPPNPNPFLMASSSSSSSSSAAGGASRSNPISSSGSPLVNAPPGAQVVPESSPQPSMSSSSSVSVPAGPASGSFAGPSHSSPRPGPSRAGDSQPPSPGPILHPAAAGPSGLNLSNRQGQSSSNSKRDRSESPVPGPSGLNNPPKRNRHLSPLQPNNAAPAPAPAPAPAGDIFHNLFIPVSNSSEAQSLRSPFEPSSSPASPMRPPLTPAGGDSFGISSSTGLNLDSMPGSPADFSMENNDLSVPSPYPPPRPTRRVPEADDGVDSTVDSNGLPFRPLPTVNLENSDQCQSSRYPNESSDSEDDDDDDPVADLNDSRSQNPFHGVPQRGQRPNADLRENEAANDDGISTSGQVDDGHFRLVPNDPADESFNRRHPPVPNPDIESLSSEACGVVVTTKSERVSAASHHSSTARLSSSTTPSSAAAGSGPSAGPSNARVPENNAAGPSTGGGASISAPGSSTGGGPSNGNGPGPSDNSPDLPNASSVRPSAAGQRSDAGPSHGVVVPGNSAGATNSAGTHSAARSTNAAGSSSAAGSSQASGSSYPSGSRNAAVPSNAAGTSAAPCVGSSAEPSVDVTDRQQHFVAASANGPPQPGPSHEAPKSNGRGNLIQPPSEPVAGPSGLRFEQERKPQPPPQPAPPQPDASAQPVDNFLAGHDLSLDQYDDNGDANLSSNFQALDSLEQPVDLEDIQLQRLLPETSSGAARAEMDTNSNFGVGSSSSAKFMLLDGEYPLNGPSSHQASNNGNNNLVEVSLPQRPIGLNQLGMAFSGLPSSGDPPRPSPASASSNHSSSQQQHSSILESMSGPLSKRLRTLHKLELKMESDDGVPSGSKSPPQQGGSGLNHASHEGNNCNGSEAAGVAQEGAATPAKKVANGNGKKHANNNNKTPGAKGDQSSSSTNDDSPPAGLGGTQHTYNVTIEHDPPPFLAVKSKRLFAAPKATRSYDDSFLLPPSIEDALDTDFLPQDPVKEGCVGLSSGRGKRSRKERNVWCRDCRTHYSHGCYIHESKHSNFVITDNPIQSRAKASLPQAHLVFGPVQEDPANAGDPIGRAYSSGIFARKRIPKKCRFGPIEGRLVSDSVTSWPIDFTVRVNGRSMSIDVSDEESSNWMGLVRPARFPQEQNLSLRQEEGQLYFVVTRNIGPRQELRVWYSPEYAEERQLPLLTNPELQTEIRAVSTERKVKVLLPEDGAGTELPPEEVKRASSSGGGRRQQTRCPTCRFWFQSDSTYRVHLFCHQETNRDLTVTDAMSQAGRSVEQLSPGMEMRFQCPECEQQFETWLKLVDHVGIHGSATKPRRPAAESRAGARDDYLATGREIKLKCDLCYKSFSSTERLMKHMAVHGADESKPLPCKHCGKRFLTNSALACHVKIHSTEETAYDCPICGVKFQQLVALKEHVHIHRINGKYDCPHCPKQFFEYPQIRKHIRAFHGLKRFKCDRCDKSFSSADKLKQHQVTHSDVKEFQCTECGKQFRRKDKMKEHWNRIHNKSNNQLPPSQPSSRPAASSGDAASASSSSPSAAAASASSASSAAGEKVGNETDANSAEADRAGGDDDRGSREQKAKFVPKVSPLDYHRFIYKCHECFLGFKRRGMLVNHLAKRHPNISASSVPELNLPILKTTKDYFCQYCSKVYKSSSKRKSHILKNHPGEKLPVSARDKTGLKTAGGSNPTYSTTVGSVTSLPHNCPSCHKQYASHAKLLQHQRTVHQAAKRSESEQPKKSKTEEGEDSPKPGPSGLQQKSASEKSLDLLNKAEVYDLHQDSYPRQFYHDQDLPHHFEPAASPLPSGSSGAANIVHVDTQVLNRFELSSPPELNLQTADGEIVQLTRVPQDEALRLASSGATVIHVPTADEQHPPQPVAAPQAQLHDPRPIEAEVILVDAEKLAEFMPQQERANRQ